LLADISKLEQTDYACENEKVFDTTGKICRLIKIQTHGGTSEVNHQQFIR